MLTPSVGEFASRKIRMFCQEDQRESIESTILWAEEELRKKGFGLQTIYAENIAESMNVVSQMEMDVMLFDLFMPFNAGDKENPDAGLTVVEDLVAGKNGSLNQSKPFILLSVHEQQDEWESLIDYPTYHGFINKMYQQLIVERIVKMAVGVRFRVGEMEDGYSELSPWSDISARIYYDDEKAVNLIYNCDPIRRQMKQFVSRSKLAVAEISTTATIDVDKLAAMLLLDEEFAGYFKFRLDVENENQDFDVVCIHESGEVVSIGQDIVQIGKSIEGRVDNLLSLIDPSVKLSNDNEVVQNTTCQSVVFAVHAQYE